MSIVFIRSLALGVGALAVTGSVWAVGLGADSAVASAHQPSLVVMGDDDGRDGDDGSGGSGFNGPGGSDPNPNDSPTNPHNKGDNCYNWGTC